MLNTEGVNRDCPYAAYYLNQAGNGMPVFRGTLHQRGHGFGSLFSSLFKIATPILKQGGRYLARHALNTGRNIATDVLTGEPLRQAVKRQFENTGRTLVSDTAEYFNKMQQGNGSRRSNVNKKPRQQTVRSIKKTSLKRKQRIKKTARKSVKKNKPRTVNNKKKTVKKKKRATSTKKELIVDKLF